MKNKSPLNYVRGQHFILRKLIKCVSWRPSLIPSRNNRQMNLVWSSVHFHPLHTNPALIYGWLRLPFWTVLNGGEEEINGIPVPWFYDMHISACTDRCILIIGQCEIAVWEQTNEAESEWGLRAVAVRSNSLRQISAPWTAHHNAVQFILQLLEYIWRI